MENIRVTSQSGSTAVNLVVHSDSLSLGLSQSRVGKRMGDNLHKLPPFRTQSCPKKGRCQEGTLPAVIMRQRIKLNLNSDSIFN
jgi:hypothetical protein